MQVPTIRAKAVKALSATLKGSPALLKYPAVVIGMKRALEVSYSCMHSGFGVLGLVAAMSSIADAEHQLLQPHIHINHQQRAFTCLY